jgi:uncharacterized phage-associated protein
MSDKLYSAAAIANTFMKLSRIDKVKVFDQIKLLKLLYFSQELSYKRRKKKLINSPFIAMPYGPVCIDVYEQSKKFGNDIIPDYVRFKSSTFITENSGKQYPEVDINDTDTLRLLYDVWVRYSGIDSMELSNITHKKNGPWDRTWEKAKSEGVKYKEISEEDICKYAITDLE